MRFRLRILRWLLLLPAWIASLSEEPVPLAMSHAEFSSYRDSVRGTFSEIMKRHGCDPGLSFLGDADAMRIFSSKGESE
jgi:hypothetical protein